MKRGKAIKLGEYSRNSRVFLFVIENASGRTEQAKSTRNQQMQLYVTETTVIKGSSNDYTDRSL